MDKLTVLERSKNMAAIKSLNTLPEIKIRKLLFKLGFRYRIHVKIIPGNPDIYLKKYNTTIFINGCFWHGHKNCKFVHIPKTNVVFWTNKIKKNIQRDRKNNKKLKRMGYNVIIIWECRLLKSSFDNSTKKLLKNLEINLKKVNENES